MMWLTNKGHCMTELYYTKQGDGAMDVLLIHGFASSCRMWESLIRYSKLPATWWAIDLLGFGQSAPAESNLLDDDVNAVIRFIETHNIQPQVIISHSTGGAVALKLAATRPDLVKTQVLISPVVTGEFTSGGMFSKIVRSAAGTAILRSSPALLQMIQKSGIAAQFADIAGIGIKDKAVKRQIVEDFHKMNPASSIETLISLAQCNMTPFLADMQHPTLVVVGDKDITVPCSEGKLAHKHMPNARLKVFEGVYHHPHEEHPEEFAELVSDFVVKSTLA
jgi:pimeloyl-ACP methyl ester carboxylesterase